MDVRVGPFLGEQTIWRVATELWRPLEGTGPLMGDRKGRARKRREVRGKILPTVTLRCEYLSFECLTPGYLTPRTHSVSISLHITEDPSNTVSETPCRAQRLRLWAPVRVGSGEWTGRRVLWAGWTDSKRAVEPGGDCRWENSDATPGSETDNSQRQRRSGEAMSQNVRSPFTLGSVPVFQIWLVD